MSSDSSDSESELNKIKEAVDVNFFKENLYSNNECKKKAENSLKPISNRNQNHENSSFNPFSVKVTSEFQSFVSKHLARLLDEIIDDTKIISKNKKCNTGQLRSGVKLLCSSKAYLEVSNSSKPSVKPKKFVKEKKFDSKFYKKRAKEVAVTPEWVLSQEETRYWASNDKGNIEIVKLQ